MFQVIRYAAPCVSKHAKVFPIHLIQRSHSRVVQEVDISVNNLRSRNSSIVDVSPLWLQLLTHLEETTLGEQSFLLLELFKVKDDIVSNGTRGTVFRHRPPMLVLPARRRGKDVLDKFPPGGKGAGVAPRRGKEGPKVIFC